MFARLKFPFLFLILSLFPVIAFAQNKNIESRAVNDSSSVIQRLKARDSAKAVVRTAGDTSKIKEEFVRVNPISLVGAVEPYGDSTKAITRSEIPWIEYRYIGDVLWTRPGMYIRDLASPGENNQMTIGGVDARAIGFLVNGISGNSPITGTYDLSLFPVDDIERIEFITGPRAFLYGMNTTGGTINVVTKSFYTNKPYSRLRYSQGVNSYSQTDAEFSQNIFNKFNFTFGLARNVFGSNLLDRQYAGRFPNSNNDEWSFRTKLRYDLSNSFNILFSHYYYQTWTGLNGGVSLQQLAGSSVFSDYATVNNYDAYQKIFQNDLNLTFAAHPDGDSLQTTTLSFFYSNQLRLYRDEENRIYYNVADLRNHIFLQSDHQFENYGALLRHAWHTSFQDFTASLEEENINILKDDDIGTHHEQRLSASAKEEVTLLQPFSFAFFGRVDRYRKNNLFGFGADARFTVIDGISLFGGVSTSERTPTLQELYWPSDSTHTPTPRLFLNNEHHQTEEAGISLVNADWFNTTISYEQRTIKNSISVSAEYSASTAGQEQVIHFVQSAFSQTYRGVNAGVRSSYLHFHLDANATYLHLSTIQYDSTTLRLLPEWYADGSFYYRNLLADGHLDLKIGFRARYISQQNGMTPNNESEMYVPYALASFGPSADIDFFLIGKLGNAYVHFIWENLTGNQYMLTPIYPMYDRNVRFGVSWVFWN
jgi:outer membrane cobalamin receptor